jgi:salicylate hydroxylase
MLSPDDPAGVSHYAHESAYRCIVEMEKVRPVWNNLAEHPIMFTGKGAHIMTYPIAGHKYLNVAACIRDDQAWPDNGRHSVKASKSEMAEAFSQFGPSIRFLFQLVPDEQNRWGLFDTLDHPLKTYAFGNVTLAGDAAHASTPHHGAGACMGVEDALILSVLLEQAVKKLEPGTNGVGKSKVLTKVFEVYDAVRRPRCEWVVASSRLQGQVVKGEAPEITRDAESFLQHTINRYGEINGYNWKQAVERAVSLFE